MGKLGIFIPSVPITTFPFPFPWDSHGTHGNSQYRLISITNSSDCPRGHRETDSGNWRLCSKNVLTSWQFSINHFVVQMLQSAVCVCSACRMYMVLTWEQELENFLYTEDVYRCKVSTCSIYKSPILWFCLRSVGLGLGLMSSVCMTYSNVCVCVRTILSNEITFDPDISHAGYFDL